MRLEELLYPPPRKTKPKRSFHLSRKGKICFVLFASLLITGVLGLPYLGTISNTGNISTVMAISLSTDNFHWGTLDPSKSYQNQVDITNIGNVPLTLSMTPSGLPSYLTLSWNQEGTPLAVGASTTATFTLDVASGATPEAFNFDITINNP